MRSQVLILAIVFSALLVACSQQTATGNAVKVTAPSKNCALEGFTCYAGANSDSDVTLALTNQLGASISSGALSLVTGDCMLVSVSTGTGYIPRDGDTSVTFRCTKPLPASFDGTLSLTYTLDNGKTGVAHGTVAYRTPN